MFPEIPFLSKKQAQWIIVRRTTRNVVGLRYVTGRVRELSKGAPSIIQEAVMKREGEDPSMWLQAVDLGLKIHFS